MTLENGSRGQAGGLKPGSIILSEKRTLYIECKSKGGDADAIKSLTSMFLTVLKV